MVAFVQLFGRPRIDVAGATHALPPERRYQLLAFLALKQAWTGRAELAALLWPELPPKLAGANLRKTLFRLQALPWALSIESQGNALRVVVDCDVARFEHALRDGRVDEALRFDAAHLLAGYDDAASEPWNSWLGFERARLAAAWRAAALDRLAGEMDAADALDLSTRMLAIDPADEDALHAHMGWLASGGQVAAARAAYREFAAALQRDYGVEPSAAVKALHDALGNPPVAAAAPAPAAPADEAFVGRSAELQAIAQALAGGARLASLVGPGGAGKTRLAHRALGEQAARHEHGAFFISLEEVAEGDDFFAALVRQLDLGATGADPKAQLEAWLRERQVLLALDNFEQLASAATLLDELLDACPRLTLLVTSRVRLGLAREVLVPVHGLPCPDPEDGDRLQDFDAARLFIAVARRADPGFVASEAGSIIDICRQVDGLPLALELAAAWTRLLTCEAIAAELRQGTELLRASDATHPARHASLELVFEQSWAMLGRAERDALARLSVFHGGMAPDAARVVTGASVAVLASLVDKSLLRKDGRRLAMHPVVHQLAGLKLEGVERAKALAAHAAHFLAVLEQSTLATQLADRAVLAALEADQENWKAAWRHAARTGELTALVQAAPTLRAWSDHRGRTPEACGLLQEALVLNASPALARFEPVLLSAVAHCLERLDRFSEATAAAHRALQVGRRVTDPETRLRCLNTLGACNLRLARNDDARRYYQMALKLAPSVPNPRYTAVLLQNLAQIERRQDRPQEALRLLLDALARFREIGDHASQALSLYQLGSMQCAMGEIPAGVESLKAALTLCDGHGLHRTRGYVLTGLADAAIESRDFEAARLYASQGLELARVSGARMLESWMLLHHARLALRDRDMPGARSELRGAVELAMQVGSPVAQVAAVICFGELLSVQGDKDCAAQVLAFARTQSSVSAHDRRQIDAVRSEWKLPAAGHWPGLSLAQLGERIAGETPLAHASLIAHLRGAAA